jgi:NACHT domain/Restriction endonuclease
MEERPVATSTRHLLPFDRLDPEVFERLCLWLVCSEGYRRPQHYGLAGSDGGHDVIAFRGVDGAEELWSFQCKRVRSLRPAQVVEAVTNVDAVGMPAALRGVVFVTTCAVSKLAREEGRRVAAARGLECEFWAVSELDRAVKQHPEIVCEFFAHDNNGRDTAPAPPTSWLLMSWWRSVASAAERRPTFLEVRPLDLELLRQPSWVVPQPDPRHGPVATEDDADASLSVVDHPSTRQRERADVCEWESLRRGRRDRRLVVVGDAGFGKSFVLRGEASRAAERALDGLHTGETLRQSAEWPIWCRLDALATHLSEGEPFWCAVTRASVAHAGGAVNGAALATLVTLVEQRIADGGRVLLLLDALDEVTADHRPSLDLALAAHTASDHVSAIITTRPAGVTNPFGSGRASEFELTGFGSQEVARFVTGWFAGRDDLAQRLQQHLVGHPRLASMARVPLLCAFVCLASDPAVGPDTQLPTSRGELYHTVVTRLLRRPWREHLPQPGEGIIETRRRLLTRIAWYFAHDGAAWRDVMPIGELLDQIRAGCDDIGWTTPSPDAGPLVHAERELDQLGEVLVSAGGREGADRMFVHRTLQEFLVASHLANHESDLEPLGLLTSRRWLQPDWHEVIPTTASLLPRSSAVALVQDIAHDRPDTAFEGTYLAAQCLAELPATVDDCGIIERLAVLAPRLRAIRLLQALPHPAARQALARLVVRDLKPRPTWQQGAAEQFLFIVAEDGGLHRGASQAVEELLSRGDREMRRVMLGLIRDSRAHNNVRLWAAQLLGPNDDEARELLLTFVVDPELELSVRSQAAQILGPHVPQAHALLLDTARSSEEWAELLACLPRNADIETLSTYVARLVKVGGSFGRVWPSVIKDAARRILAVHGDRGCQAISAVLEMLGPSEKAVLPLAEALALVDPRRAAPYLAQVLRDGRNSEEVRAQAAQALPLHLTGMVHCLTAVVTHPAAPVEVRVAAAGSLARSGDLTARTALLRVLTDGRSDQAVRVAAAAALRARANTGTRSEIVAIATSQRTGGWIRLAALAALEKGDPVAHATCVELLVDTRAPDDLRAAAARALHATGLPRALDVLRRFLAPPYVTPEALQSVVLRLAPEADALLARIEADSLPHRSATGAGLSTLVGRAKVAALGLLIEIAADPQTSSEHRALLSDFLDPSREEVVLLLVHLLGTPECSERTRAAAVLALAKSSDDRTLEALLRFLEWPSWMHWRLADLLGASDEAASRFAVEAVLLQKKPGGTVPDVAVKLLAKINTAAAREALLHVVRLGMTGGCGDTIASSQAATALGPEVADARALLIAGLPCTLDALSDCADRDVIEAMVGFLSDLNSGADNRVSVAKALAQRAPDHAHQLLDALRALPPEDKGFDIADQELPALLAPLANSQHRAKLLELAISGAHPQARHAAIEALILCGDEGAQGAVTAATVRRPVEMESAFVRAVHSWARGKSSQEIESLRRRTAQAQAALEIAVGLQEYLATP